jgi:hypothetical protein
LSTQLRIITRWSLYVTTKACPLHHEVTPEHTLAVLDASTALLDPSAVGSGSGGAMSIRPLDLEGWDSLSTWGYDDLMGSYYAQLTRNGQSDDDGPEIWLTPPLVPVLRSQEELAALIAERTGAHLAAVRQAMAL